MARQRAMFCCGCGRGSIFARSLCGRCYCAEYRDRRLFGGRREQALRRDGRRCTNCGADGQIVVHHRSPGLNTTRLLCTLCRRCHARVHRLYRLRYGLPEHFRRLWEEQHPKQPEQLELPLVTSSGNGVAVLTKLEQVPLFVLSA